MKTPKRPCAVCRRWFYPNARTRHRQKTCGLDECRREWRRRTQAHWRASNPSYAAEWRLRSQAAKAEKNGEGVVIRAPPKGIERVPWDVVEEALGVSGTLLVALLVRLLLAAGKDQIRGQPMKTTEQSERLKRREAKDEIGVQVTGDAG